MLFLPAYSPKNFAADERNIMQEGSECLEVTHSHPNFTLGNQFKGIMKKNADAGNTGSRRFLPFEVLSIDIEKAKRISMDNVYAEAKTLLKSGFRYWFDDEEIAELYRESEDFQVQTAEMELLLRCFEKPTEDENYSLMTTTEILTYLGIYTHQPLVAKRMGEALKKAGYIKVSKRRNGGSPIYAYKIRKILPCPLLQTCSSQM